MINVTCPSSAVTNSTVSCPFAPVDALGNVATPDMLTQVQTLVASTFNGANGASTSPSPLAPSSSVDLVVTHNGQAFVLGCRSETTGTVVVNVLANGATESSHSIQQYAPAIQASASSLSCTSTMTAGTNAACTLVGRDGNHTLAGVDSSTPAWDIVLTSAIHGNVVMSTHYQSMGMYTASAPVLKAGVWTVRGTFAGSVVSINATDGGSTIVVNAGPIAASTTTMECPTTAPSNAPMSCTVYAKDINGNLAATEGTTGSIDVIALLPNGQPLPMDTAFSNEGGGVFKVNLTVPSEAVDGDAIRVRAFYLMQPIVSSMPMDVSGGPTSTTSFVVQPNPPAPAPTCTTKGVLIQECVEHRGKWGFTCGQHDWKRSGGCSMGEIFDVVLKKCRVQCGA